MGTVHCAVSQPGADAVLSLLLAQEADVMEEVEMMVESPDVLQTLLTIMSKSHAGGGKRAAVPAVHSGDHWKINI